jgi:AraC family transcriptional regulator
MTKPWTNVQAPPMDALATELDAPLLLLSSAQAGWEGLVAQAFHEPRELEGWVVPASPDVSLVLFTGGAIHVEWREAHEAWEGRDIQSGELILNWGTGPWYETRWWSLSRIPTQTLHLRLSRDLVARMAEQLADTDLTSLSLVRRAGIRDPLLTQIALALWRELEQPAPAGKLYAHTAAQLLALHLVRQYSSASLRVKAASSSPSGLTDRQIKHVLEFIRTHLSEDLSLEVLAQQVGFSPYHFARLVRRTLGASPHQVVLRQRIEHARRMLAETALPLARIAGESGFADQSYFTRVFKRYLGVTPRAYRQERL